MPAIQKIPNNHVAFGKISTHPLRQKLIDYSKIFNQESLKTYRIRYYQGPHYCNLNLNKYTIHAHNYIEANVILHDFLNMKLRSAHACDQYVDLQSILNDDADENFDDDDNLIFDEKSLDENDTLWLEEDEEGGKTVLTFDEQ
jgi:hypothetical protein